MALASTQSLKRVMAEYFHSLSPDVPGPVAYCTSTGPAEILWAMGYYVFFPENHGAAIGAKKQGSRYIAAAARDGISQDVCSYTTCDLGAQSLGTSPLQEAYGVLPPVPDVLVYNNQQCLEVQHWFEELGRRFNRPVFGIQSPQLLHEVSDSTLDYQVIQLRQLVGWLEKSSGRRLDPSALKETVKISADTAVRWGRVLRLGAHRPSPWTFFDQVIHMFPVVVMRGISAASAYYAQLEEELLARVEAKTPGVPGEQWRVYWDGMPMWFALRTLSEFFARQRVTVVASTYCNTWAFEDLDPANPLRSIAKAETSLFINRSSDVKMGMMTELMKTYQVDGFILHNSKTCWRNSNGHYGMKALLEQVSGLPGLIVEGDVSDERLWSKEQILTKFEAFMEIMEARTTTRRLVSGGEPVHV